MTDWLQQYTAALDMRDEREGANKIYIQRYCKLADRLALLENGAKNDNVLPHKDTLTAGTNDTLSRLRLDLASAQRERTDLSTQLSRLQAQIADLTLRNQTSEKRIATLEREKQDTERKLRDRVEELRGKAKLVEDVHDEMVGLNLQLNMADEKAERLAAENKELVRRWMERMGREADQMNTESQWS